MTGFSIAIADENQDTAGEKQWAGTSRILGPSWSRLPAITIGLLGMQILWTVELSYASPYLLSLGVSKANMAMVFVAGPLSGLIVQPVIGVLSDKSKSRFGRRRPYMIGGALLSVMALFLLGFTRSFASIVTTPGTSSNDTLTIWLAILAIYIIDFSVNVVMAVDRALIVDSIPSPLQASANAWVGRMVSVGSVLGYFLGEANIVATFPFFGKTQLEVFVVLTSILFLSTHLLTAFAVKEKVLVSSKYQKSLLEETKSLFVSISTLPRVIRQIFVVQFFAWLGWFPILFYTTVFIGELHKRASPIPKDEAAALALDEEATRIGSGALFISSLLSLLTNIVLPFFVREAAHNRPQTSLSSTSSERSCMERCQIRLVNLWTLSHALFAFCAIGAWFTKSVFSASVLVALTGISWAITNWAPLTLLAEAILADSESPGDAGYIRLSDRRTTAGDVHVPSSHGQERERFLVGEDEGDEDDGHTGDSKSATSQEDGEDGDDGGIVAQETGPNAPPPLTLLQNSGARLSRVDLHALEADEREAGDADIPVLRKDGLSDRAGIILGIHNMFVVMPQFLSIGLSSIVFAIFEPGKSVLPPTPKPKEPATVAAPPTSSPVPLSLRQEGGQVIAAQGVNSVALVFAMGGFATLVALVLCWRLAREMRHR